MPLSVYVYMPVADFGFLSLIFGRLLSALFLILTFFILKKLYLKYAKQMHAEPRGEFLFSLMFFANLFLVNWAVTVRIY